MILFTMLLACSAPEPQDFSACAVPVGGWLDGQLTEPVLSSLVGTVLDTGEGAPPEDCFTAGAITGSGLEHQDEAWWLGAADSSGQEWVVGVWLPDGPPAPEVGQALFVDIHYEVADFGPLVAWVELDTPRLFVGTGGQLADLPESPQSLSLTQGGRVGRDHDECGRWAYYDLVADGMDVPYGSRVQVGDYEVRHGGYVQTRKDKGCTDWHADEVTVAISE